MCPAILFDVCEKNTNSKSRLTLVKHRG